MLCYSINGSGKKKPDSSKCGGRTEEDLPIITLKPQETMLYKAFLKPSHLYLLIYGTGSCKKVDFN